MRSAGRSEVFRSRLVKSGGFWTLERALKRDDGPVDDAEALYLDTGRCTELRSDAAALCAAEGEDEDDCSTRSWDSS